MISTPTTTSTRAATPTAFRRGRTAGSSSTSRARTAPGSRASASTKKTLLYGEEVGHGPRGLRPRRARSCVRRSGARAARARAWPGGCARERSRCRRRRRSSSLPRSPTCRSPAIRCRPGGSSRPRIRTRPDRIEDRPLSPQSRAAVMAPHAGKKVGKRTIAQLIQDAVSVRRPRSTIEIGRYVDQKVQAATAGQQRTTRSLAFLLIVALVALGGLVLWSRRLARRHRSAPRRARPPSARGSPAQGHREPARDAAPGERELRADRSTTREQEGDHHARLRQGILHRGRRSARTCSSPRNAPHHGPPPRRLGQCPRKRRPRGR